MRAHLLRTAGRVHLASYLACDCFRGFLLVQAKFPAPMKSYLAIFFPNSAQTGTEQVMRGVTEGMFEAAKTSGCPFFIHRVREIDEVQGSLGVIGMMGADQGRERFLKLGIPLVNVSNLRGPVPEMANVLNDDEATGRMAAAHLLEKGYRSFIAVGQAGPQWSRERMKGFLGEVQAAGFASAAVDVHLSDVSQDFRPSAFLDMIWEQVFPLLREAPLATGIFAASDLLAWPILLKLREEGDERAHTTALLGVDNLHDQLFDPTRTAGLSSIQPGFRAAGGRGLQLLIDAAQDPDRPCTASLRVPPEKLHARGSTSGMACEDPVVSAVVRELWAMVHQSQDPPIREIARRQGMSLRNLELRFEAELGLSPRMLVAEMRIQLGQELLRDTEISITEVSRRCGYANSTTFSTFFGKKTGKTPREWRMES